MTFTVIDCYNSVFNYDEDIWEYDVAETDYKVKISTSDTSKTILDKLVKVGYFAEPIEDSELDIEWLENDLIVVYFADETYQPVCRLEVR